MLNYVITQLNNLNFFLDSVGSTEASKDAECLDELELMQLTNWLNYWF